MGGSGGEPWMPSRCVDAPDGFTVEATRAWEVEINLPPTPVVYLHDLEARWWFSREGECFIDPYWNGRNETITLRIEPSTHTTPEGEQTDVMVLSQVQGMGASVYAQGARHTVYFGGCTVDDDVENDYSASAPEHVAIYVRGELVAGCEP